MRWGHSAQHKQKYNSKHPADSDASLRSPRVQNVWGFFPPVFSISEKRQKLPWRRSDIRRLGRTQVDVSHAAARATPRPCARSVPVSIATTQSRTVHGNINGLRRVREIETCVKSIKLSVRRVKTVTGEAVTESNCVLCKILAKELACLVDVPRDYT